MTVAPDRPVVRGRCLVLLLLVALGARPAQAQVFETVGTRALGMGGAFVAVADDATANYWNPAGLSEVFFSALVESQRMDTRVGADPLRQAGGRHLDTFAAIGTPSLGLAYYRSRSWSVGRAGDVAQLSSVVTHHLGATFVQPLAPGVALATVLKVVRGTASVGVADGVAPIEELVDVASALMGRTTNRFDIDVGLLAGNGPVRLGLVARNLREPEFAASDEVIVTLARQFRAGVSIRPTPSLVMALDADLTTTDTLAGPRRVIAVGLEQRFGRLSVRAGGRVNREREDPELIGAVGLSLEIMSSLWLDGQATGGREDGDRGWGLTTRVGF